MDTASNNSHYGTMENNTHTPHTHSYTHTTSSGHAQVMFRKNGSTHSSNIHAKEDILLEESMSSDHENSDQQL